MKPSIIVMDYVTLIQDEKITISDVPSNLVKEVERWLNYFSTGTLPTDSAATTPTVVTKEGATNAD